jgi:all-trans-8'-apo-beta-carotenal 15,15'-oxygenase
MIITTTLAKAIVPALMAATAAAFAPLTYHGVRLSQRHLVRCSSTVTKSGPMAWTLNTEAYGEFDQEDWGWVYSTVPPEACAANVVLSEIEGEIPMDLRGTLYRIGPGNFERAGVRFQHALDGDGFVAAFNFTGNGTVRYSGSFIETEYFLQEKEKDAILYRNVFGTQPDEWWKNVGNVNLKNVANTNIVEWGGRLLALWEGGRPYELSPALETLPPPRADEEWGPFQNLGKPDCGFRGVTLDEGGPIDTMLNFGRSFTAHPHIFGDGKAQSLVGIKTALNPLTESVQLEIIAYDQQWSEKSKVPYTLVSAPSAPHDFSISENYYCLIQSRLQLDNVPFLLGLKSPTQVLQLSIKKPSILHLVSKRDDHKSLQFELPPYFNLHNIPKAVETADDKLILYSNGWDLHDERYFPPEEETVPFLGSWGGRYPDFRYVPPSHLYRTVVDLRSEKLVSHEQVIPGLVMGECVLTVRYFVVSPFHITDSSLRSYTVHRVSDGRRRRSCLFQCC